MRPVNPMIEFKQIIGRGTLLDARKNCLVAVPVMVFFRTHRLGEAFFPVLRSASVRSTAAHEDHHSDSAK